MRSHVSARPTRVLPRVFIFTMIVALLGVISTVTAPRALAHDVLLDTTPADGAVLQEPPHQVSLTFSGELVEMNPLIIVSDAEGEVITDTPPRIDSGTATVPLSDVGVGDYRVQWSVVSSDGHRIEGSYRFSVAAESPSAQDPSSEPTDEDPEQADTPAPPASSPSPERDPTSEADADLSGTQDSGSLPAWQALVLAAVVLGAVVLGAVIITVTRRRKR